MSHAFKCSAVPRVLRSRATAAGESALDEWSTATRLLQPHIPNDDERPVPWVEGLIALQSLTPDAELRRRFEHDYNVRGDTERTREALLNVSLFACTLDLKLVKHVPMHRYSI